MPNFNGLLSGTFCTSVTRTPYHAQLGAESALVGADQSHYDLANMRFKAGVDSYLNVLVARNDLFSAQLSLVNVRLSSMQNDVTLYKALGGGWEENSFNRQH